MSAVAQNQPLRVEIKGFKTGHFVEGKKGLGDLVNAGPKGHVEFTLLSRPKSWRRVDLQGLVNFGSNMVD
jgi:hypothetical protein